MQNDLDIRFIISVFLRRFPIFILTAILCFGVGAGVAVVLPPVYKASATMLVISQQIPSDLARSTVTVSALERIKVIEKQMMTRDTLLAIEEEFSVFPNRAAMSPSDVVEAMRSQTSFSQARLGGNKRSDEGALAFTISFNAASAQVSARVTNEFVTRILERNVKLRTGRAADTSDFFEQQVARLEAELSKLEIDIVDFKRANADKLPSTLDFRRQRLALLEQKLQLQERDRRALLDQESLLVAAMAEEKNSGRKPIAEMSDEERSLEELKRQRLMRRAILSETHPEIRALDSRIKSLEALIESDAAATAAASADQPEGETPPSDMATAMGRELELTRKRIGGLDFDIAELRKEIEVLAKSVAETPNIEMALNTLNREYDGLRAEFQQARAKLASAATGEELELKQQAERFEVVEQASLPDAPISPNRPLILMAGAVGGIGAGLALILLLELMNKAIRRPSELSRIDITPVAIIPYVYTTQEARRRRNLRIMITLGFLVLIVGGAYVVHYYYEPLDLLLDKVLEKAKIKDAIQLVRSRLNF